MASLDWTQAVNQLKTEDGRRTMLSIFKDYDHESNTQESWNPLALAAKTTDADADTFTFQEAMNHPNSDGFWDAAEKELKTLKETMKVWDEVDREPWMNVLPSTWAFRIKRFPNGLIRKFKARFCARGDRQIHGVDFFDTYAPVVSWTTVRLMLILSIELDKSFPKCLSRTEFLVYNPGIYQILLLSMIFHDPESVPFFHIK